MKTLRNKSRISAISVITILIISAVIVALPMVSAHDPAWEVPTWAYMSVTNNPIGVNQQLGIIFWPNAVPPTAVGAYGDRWTWNIEVTKPDGTKETLGPITSDPIGGGYTVYTPTEVGTYTIMAVMEDHVVTGLPVPPGGYLFGGDAAIGDLYIGDASDPVTLTVQADPVAAWQETPLPEEYWTRPINDMNRNWYVIAGNWLAGAAQQNGPTTGFGYGLAPESAHVMWTRPMYAGGIMDARLGDKGYQTYHYEGLHFTPPIILNGKLYYNVYSLPKEGWYCVDLYTGKTEYFHNTTGPITGVGGTFSFSGELPVGRLAFGQIYDYESPNQHGGFPYLWSTSGPDGTWMMFDAFSGNYICSINNIPMGTGFFGPSVAGTAVYGKEGSLLQYIIKGTPDPTNPLAPAGAPFYLQVWNTSQAIWYRDFFASNEYWMWRPILNQTFDGNNGYSLNVTIPAVSGGILAVREGEYVIGGTGGTNRIDESVVPGNLWALSLEPGKEGTLLWNITCTPPFDEVPSFVGGLFGTGGVSLTLVDPEDDVFIYSSAITRQRWGYSLATGEILWGPTESEPSLNYYGGSATVYEGKLLTSGYGGELIAYDIKTGEVLWTYVAAQEGYESPYGNYPMGIGAIADGKIYIGAGEHSPSQPLWRGSVLRCIDADTGAEIWKLPIFGVSMPSGNGGDNFAVADSYLLALNAYDNQIYCVGKGPSETTVSVQSDVVSWGDSVLFTGTVMDIAAGTKQQEQASRFPKGVPAVADEYQEDWMQYVYMQQACPANVEGVQVKLETLDPNGNFYEIGTVTADASGMYKLLWEPQYPENMQSMQPSWDQLPTIDHMQRQQSA